MCFHESIQKNRRKHRCEKPKDFMDPSQLVKDSCCPFSKRALYWHIWRSGINGLAPASDEVQRIVKKHHTFTEQHQNATQEVYIAMAQLYHEHPEFRKQLDPFHPQLAEFMAHAMRKFADQNL